MRHGSPCECICWVCLKGPVTNMFVIAIYMPHRARVKPCQDDTMSSLVALLKTVPKRDCILLMGDFNEQLPGNRRLLLLVLPESGLSGKSRRTQTTYWMSWVCSICSRRLTRTSSRSATAQLQRSIHFAQRDPLAQKPATSSRFVGRKVEARYQGKLVKGCSIHEAKPQP